jgi:hypothetical protein
MDTLLRYDISTNPFPLQASADVGDLSTAQLTIVVWNPTPANPVTLQHLSITFPVGDSKTDLTLDSTDIVAIPPSGWTLQGTEPSETSVAYIFAPEPGNGQIGPSLNFVFNSIKINRMSGTAQVEVMEGSNDCRPAHCPTKTLAITKFPNGWGQVTFQADPWPPIVPYNSGVTLVWSGPVGATYSLDYYTPQTGPVNLPALGEPALSNNGQYPATFDPPLQLTSDTVFYLNVVETIDNLLYKAQQQITATIEVPVPVITSFTGELIMAKDSTSNPLCLVLKWDTQNADTCTITDDPHPVSNTSTDGSYQIIGTVDKPLLMKYTLTAGNAAATVHSGIALQSELILKTATPGATGDTYHITCLPDGSRVYATWESIQGFNYALYVLDSTLNLITTVPFSDGVYNPTGLACSPDCSSIFMCDFLGNVLKFNTTTLQQVGSARVGNNGWGIAISHDGSRLYMVQQNSSLLVIDAATLSVLGSAPLPNVVWGTSIACSPDGLRLYVADTSNNCVWAFEPPSDPNRPLISVGQSPVFSDEPLALVVMADNTYVLVCVAQNVTTLDAATLQLVGQPLNFAYIPLGITIFPDNARAFVCGNHNNIDVIAPSVVTGGIGG